MNPQIKERFLELKLVGQRVIASSEEKRTKDLEMIAYLKSVMANHEVTDFEDIGFCYWNISDNYALLRDGHALSQNHSAFYECILKEDCGYLYWLVCDATQRLTLEKDGYSDWWWSVYREAISCNAENTYLFAEFCAHRAALYQNHLMSPKKECMAYAKANFETFLDKAKNVSEYPFYRLLHLTSVSKCFSTDNREIKELSEQMLSDLLHADAPCDFLVGEWKSFITPFGKRKCAVVGITSAVNSLIDTGEAESAKRLYYAACENGLPKNAYIEKRLK
ncbi:MAG: hypothetical protein IKT67_03545 [Lachnospiraceae bacterium]|nr:hypothetical protein [Lachnospiraceae bacterium]